MAQVEVFLIGAAVIVVVLWAALAAYLLVVHRRRTTTRRLVSEAKSVLQLDEVRGLTRQARVHRVRRLLDQSTREMLMHAAADRQTPPDTFDVLAAYMVDRWAGRLEKDASSHRTSRDKWRRITAFRILYRLNHPATIALLARGVEEHDTELADAGLGLLGQSTDARAMDVLFDALKQRRHPASLVASHIEHSPQRVPDRLQALLGESDPVLRFWGATLLARYPSDAVESLVAPLTSDVDPRVRKAALQTLGIVGHDLAADCAARLLTDPFAYVRAHAARTLGELGCVDLAPRVAVLLGDEDWWTRLAARESLEAMGSDVWPVLMRCLSHDDRFVRNGAAEVMQNIGVLDSLVVMEAASDSPAPAKIALLRRIAAAGGVRFTESLVERAGPRIGPRIRELLTTIGLEHVQAA